MLVYRLSAGGKEKKRHQVSHEKKYGSNNCFFGTTTYKDAPTWFMERIVATGADDSADKQQQQFGQLETRERRV